MTTNALQPADRSDIVAGFGTANAVMAFILATIRLIVQANVNGGHGLFAGPLGAAWWAFFIAAIAIAAGSAVVAVVLLRRGE